MTALMLGRAKQLHSNMIVIIFYLHSSLQFQKDFIHKCLSYLIFVKIFFKYVF